MTTDTPKFYLVDIVTTTSAARLCQILGEEVRRGRLPRDLAVLGELIGNVCCRNALRYFGFEPARLSRANHSQGPFTFVESIIQPIRLDTKHPSKYSACLYSFVRAGCDFVDAEPGIRLAENLP